MTFFKSRAISKLGISPRKPALDRAGIAIAIIVKNEAQYLEEWAKFHLKAGVSHFVVYDNGSTDDTVETIRNAVPEGAVTIVPWAQNLKDGRSGAELHNQVLAFAHALANYGPRFRWMAFVDVDEFIVPKGVQSIGEALAQLGEAAHVSLPWHMFGRGGNDTPPVGGVISNYLMRMKNPQNAKHALNWKCIVDPARVTGVRVHGMEIDGKGEGVNDVGQLASHKERAAPSFFSNARLQLNHYYTRSDQDLQTKIHRGSNKTVEQRTHLRRVMRIVDEIEADEVEDRAALAFFNGDDQAR